MKAYHYTFLSSADSIMWAGLKPLRPNFSERDHEIVPLLEPTARQTIAGFENYFVALESPAPEGWIRSNLFDRLFARIDPSHGICLLELELSRPQDVHVKDAQLYFGEMMQREDGVLQGGTKSNWISYLNSAVPLSDYQGNYQAPELWIPESVPPKSIQIINIPERIRRLFLDA